jgi:hypothetical protein
VDWLRDDVGKSNGHEGILAITLARPIS